MLEDFLVLGAPVKTLSHVYFPMYAKIYACLFSYGGSVCKIRLLLSAYLHET